MKESLKDLLKLTNFELERISKFLFGLVGLTLISNLIGYLFVPFRYMSQVNEFIASSSGTVQDAREIFGHFSFFDMTYTFWIIAPIAIGISALLFYSVFTWYREWFGKNTFAYRLLILPVPRMNIFFSKLITIFISIFALIASQMISLAIGFPIVSTMIDSDFFLNLSLMESIQMNNSFLYLFPINLSFFIAVNGIGLVALLVLFTFILMERSFGLKGIIFGITYALFSLLLILFPLLIPNIFKNYYILYGSETIILEIISFTIVGLVSIFISRYLINKKITV